MAPAVLKSA